MLFHDEAEEEIGDHIIDIGTHLIGLVFEAFAIIAEGYVKVAMISIMLKRLTQPNPA